jgi:hypothetical protein
VGLVGDEEAARPLYRRTSAASTSRSSSPGMQMISVVSTGGGSHRNTTAEQL